MKPDRLARIAAKYRASLAARADEIERIAAALPDAQARAVLTIDLHKLSGSAGFYGEDELAMRARTLELRLEEEPLKGEDLKDFRSELAAALCLMRA